MCVLESLRNVNKEIGRFSHRFAPGVRECLVCACVCVSVCVCAPCVRVCTRVCARVRVRVCTYVRMCSNRSVLVTDQTLSIFCHCILVVERTWSSCKSVQRAACDVRREAYSGDFMYDV